MSEECKHCWVLIDTQVAKRTDCEKRVVENKLTRICKFAWFNIYTNIITRNYYCQYCLEECSTTKEVPDGEYQRF